jgi:acetyl esterase/lipase
MRSRTDPAKWRSLPGLLLIQLFPFGAVYSSLAHASEPATNANVRGAKPSFQEVAPPPEEAQAIRLSSKSENPNPESWLRMRGTEAPPWWLGPTGRLVVRNVSQATLTPFLPAAAKATGAAMIVAPGGGTLVLGMDLQGYQIARWLNERGIAAFVLKYRLVPTPGDLSAFLKVVEGSPSSYSEVVSEKQGEQEEIATREDGLEAVRYVRAHATQWKISPDRVGFMGFSAGGYTAVGVALKADEPSKPNVVALIYGTMPSALTVAPSAPPIFIAASSDDPLYSVGSGADAFTNTYMAWQQAHVPAELHMFSTGGHGFGITPKGKSSDQWTGLLDHWLRERQFATGVEGTRH